MDDGELDIVSRVELICQLYEKQLAERDAEVASLKNQLNQLTQRHAEDNKRAETAIPPPIKTKTTCMVTSNSCPQNVQLLSFSILNQTDGKNDILCVRCNPNKTVMQVKQKIAHTLGIIKLKRLELCHSGIPMDNNKKLTHYKIKPLTQFTLRLAR
jgi:hypothetical protein